MVPAITDVRLSRPVTHEFAVPKPPSTRMTTGRTDEAARPSQPFQKTWVVGTGMGTFHLPSLSSTPVKWIPQSRIITC